GRRQGRRASGARTPADPRPGGSCRRCRSPGARGGGAGEDTGSRMTRRGRLVLALGLVTYAASWAFGPRPLVPAAVGLVLVPALAWGWVRATTRPVRVERVPRRERSLEGDDVEIELRAALAAAPPSLAVEESIGGLGRRRTELERHGRRAAA